MDYVCVLFLFGLPRWLSGKKFACQADVGSMHGSGKSLEKEMAIHSSVLAWETPWTEEPGGIQAMGSQRVAHNLATKQQQHIFI